MKERDKAIISLHTHNDRGTGVACTELGLLAGADRVEGTLFGNGERTGNLDIVTVALNMNSHGIQTGLDFSDIATIREVYERTTRMTVPERQPYAGELVFTAFSGSHQDAIKKGLDLRKDGDSDSEELWGVPYLTIDPRDIGRTYEAIIRINSQSGKGGVAYILDREHGLELPKTMHPEVGIAINNLADAQGKELAPDEIRDAFYEAFVNQESPLNLADYELVHRKDQKGRVTCHSTVYFDSVPVEILGEGNGPINAFVTAMDNQGWKNFRLIDYRSHAIGVGSATDSAAYVQIQNESNDKLYWGCGIDPSIEMAGLRALVSAYNRLVKSGDDIPSK